ncbi:10419_t:CDS:1, partial [Funneliformis geosporum]
MPTIKGFEKKKGFRFFFTSHDRGEEPHIHAEGSSGIMKVSLKNLSVEYSRGLTYSEERKILAIAEENQKHFLK